MASPYIGRSVPLSIVYTLLLQHGDCAASLLKFCIFGNTRGSGVLIFVTTCLNEHMPELANILLVIRHEPCS